MKFIFRTLARRALPYRIALFPDTTFRACYKKPLKLSGTPSVIPRDIANASQGLPNASLISPVIKQGIIT